LQVIEEVEAEAIRAVILVAILAVKGLLLSLGHIGAVAAFHWLRVCLCDHHSLVLMLPT